MSYEVTYLICFSQYLDSMYWDDNHLITGGEEYQRFLDVWYDNKLSEVIDVDFDYTGTTTTVTLDKTLSRELEYLCERFPNCISCETLSLI